MQKLSARDRPSRGGLNKNPNSDDLLEDVRGRCTTLYRPVPVEYA
jgi:hypothetical protein